MTAVETVVAGGLGVGLLVDGDGAAVVVGHATVTVYVLVTVPVV